jgi:hypothetical protein
MTHKLYLDDIRNPKNSDFSIVRSFEDAVNHVIQHGFPNYVSFDHDLGEGDSRTGYDFAKWLVEYDLNHNAMPKDFDYNVHSANPVGAENIRHLLDCYLRNK